MCLPTPPPSSLPTQKMVLTSPSQPKAQLSSLTSPFSSPSPLLSNPSASPAGSNPSFVTTFTATHEASPSSLQPDLCSASLTSCSHPYPHPPLLRAALIQWCHPSLSNDPQLHIQGNCNTSPWPTASYIHSVAFRWPLPCTSSHSRLSSVLPFPLHDLSLCLLCFPQFLLTLQVQLPCYAFG